MKRFLTILFSTTLHSVHVKKSRLTLLSDSNSRSMARSVKWLCIVVASVASAPVALKVDAVSPVTATASRVTVGSPSGHTPQNHQNEPAVAMDAYNPDVLVAGVNDFIDLPPCPRDVAMQRARCEAQTSGATPGIGLSGVYFSFNRGQEWIQPTYTGWSQRSCAPETVCTGEVGPIGTLPWYYEAGLISLGDPAVAVGPRPVNGSFSWENGSRVYYANLAVDFPGRDTLRRALLCAGC